MYVDVKTTVWQRIKLNEREDISVEEVIKLLDKYGPSELWEHEGRFFPDWENMVDTEEYMTVEENNGCSTMELYSDDDELLWENSNYKNE